MKKPAFLLSPPFLIFLLPLILTRFWNLETPLFHLKLLSSTSDVERHLHIGITYIPPQSPPS